MNPLVEAAGSLCSSFLVAMMLTGAIAWIVARVRGVNEGPYLRTAAWIALAIAVLTAAASVPRTLERTQSSSANLNKLSSAEQARFKEIVAGVTRDPDYLTPTVHGEFWQLVYKTGMSSTTAITRMRTSVTELGGTYWRLFYEDALIAVQRGKPVQSPEREKFEKDIVNRGVVSQGFISQNDLLMGKIASGQAISSADGGPSVTLDEGSIRMILASLDDATKRLDKLFTPPTGVQYRP